MSESVKFSDAGGSSGIRRARRWLPNQRNSLLDCLGPDVSVAL